MYKYQKPVNLNILKVSTQLANLIQQKVDVLLLSGRIGKHTPEEIDYGSQRLIANQNRALFHHPAFDPRSNLQRNILKIIIGSINTWRNWDRRGPRCRLKRQIVIKITQEVTWHKYLTQRRQCNRLIITVTNNNSLTFKRYQS